MLAMGSGVPGCEEKQRLGVMPAMQSLFYSCGGEHWPPAPGLGES